MPCCPKQRLHGWSHSLLKTPTHTFHFQGLVNTLWSTSCLGSIPILRSWSPFTKKTCHPAKYREMAILEFPSKTLPGSPVVTCFVTYLMRPDHYYSKEARDLMRNPWNFSHGYFTLRDQTQSHVSAWGAMQPILYNSSFVLLVPSWVSSVLCEMWTNIYIPKIGCCATVNQSVNPEYAFLLIK